jgi:hypothetical protein
MAKAMPWFIRPVAEKKTRPQVAEISQSAGLASRVRVLGGGAPAASSELSGDGAPASATRAVAPPSGTVGASPSGS